MRWWLSRTVIAAIVLGTGCSPAMTPESATDRPSAGSTVAEGGSARLNEVIDLVTIAAEPARRGYDRDLFEHWVDTNRSGCTARQDVLLTQAVGIIQRDPFDPCFVVEADWYLPFDGGSHSGQPGDIDIDHVVALAEAWDSGAADWSSARRRQFANDPLNLVVSDRQVNRDKADRDVAEWRPPERSSWCLMATMVTLTKLRYDLDVDPAEMRALREMADTCDDGDQVVMSPLPAPGTIEFDDLVQAILAERSRPVGSDAG